MCIAYNKKKKTGSEDVLMKRRAKENWGYQLLKYGWDKCGLNSTWRSIYVLFNPISEMPWEKGNWFKKQEL